MPPPETYKSEIGSQSTMCQVHTGAYVSLLAPGKSCHPGKTTFQSTMCQVHTGAYVSLLAPGKSCHPGKTTFGTS